MSRPVKVTMVEVLPLGRPKFGKQESDSKLRLSQSCGHQIEVPDGDDWDTPEVRKTKRAQWLGRIGLCPRCEEGAARP